MPHASAATVVVEAEDYDVRDAQGEPRDFYRIGAGQGTMALPSPDPDPSHVVGASGEGYIEVLPDTRVTSDDSSDEDGLFGTAGDGPLVLYYVAFPRAGTYYLWIRGFSTGTEDETVFFAIDQEWDSGVLVKLCSGVEAWQWGSHERKDASSCAMIGQVSLEVPSAGLHTVAVSAREDGLELDKWLLTTDADFVPRGLGPNPTQTAAP